MVIVNKDLFNNKRKEIFGKIYIANVRNRLRELENPNDADCKRWIWELVQNAKDSISGQPNKKVDIEIIVSDDVYTFKHNGSPFNEDTLFALLYKFSEGKTNNFESTGRFGTGFLTTHSLSKIVEISGDIIIDGKTEPRGFEVTMYRDGDDKELLKGLSDTENSFNYFEYPLTWTSFKYKAMTKRNKEAGRLGIQNFKENIDKVMLFCPEINSIKLNDNGKIELDCNNDIYINSSSPSLFCSLPLVGSEAHEFPFIINSPDFEPDSERQAIFLDGIDIDEKTQKISDPGINKKILIKSQEIYKDLLKFICNNNIGKRYLTARGLRSIPNITRFFNQKWYKHSFIDPMRKILLSFPIIMNEKGEYKTIPEIYVPNYDYEENKNKRKIYEFIAQLFNVVPSYDESINLEKYIWRDDNSIDFVDIKECVNHVSNYKEVFLLKNNINEDVWTWLNNFLPFIKRYHPEYLEDYAIIPNMNSKFVMLDNILATSVNVPDNIIECLEDLNINWKETHIHKKITKYTTGTDHNIKFAESTIRDTLSNEWSSKVLVLMQYIPYIPCDMNIPCDMMDREFIQKRKTIYELCSVIWNMSEMKDGSGLHKELWNGIDEMVFDNLLSTIQNLKEINGQTLISIDFLNKVLKCVTKYYSDYTEYSIIPNQNGKFCKIYDLYKDSNIPEIFKECLKKFFNVDIKKELIHKEINYNIFRNVEEKGIYSYKPILRKNFLSNSISKNIKCKAARYLIRIVPSDSTNNQRKLFNLYKIFTKQNFSKNEYCEVNESDYNYGIWDYSNKYIHMIINDIIEENSSLDMLANYLGKNKEDTFNYLKDFILEFSSLGKIGKIVPNQYDELCNINELMNEGDSDEEDSDDDNDDENMNRKINYIPEELKDISKDLGYDVRSKLVHKKMGILCNRSMSYKKICRIIDEFMRKKYNDKSSYSDSNFRNGAFKLIEEYFYNNDEKEMEKYFEYTYSMKSNITIDVIIDKSDRETLVKIRNKYGDEEVRKLIEHSDEVKEALKYLEFSKNNQSSNNTSTTIVCSGSRSIQVTYNSEMDSYEKKIYNEVFNTIIKYGNDFYFENPNEEVGITGEAYIYELLLDSQKFKKVTWKMMNENGRPFRYNGKIYRILPDGSHYDIEVETFSNYKYFIEVKSTRYKLGNNKVPFLISRSQINMMELTKKPNNYILAIVFDVMSVRPSHFFLTMNKNIDENEDYISENNYSDSDESL
ncbi:hypothetical protein BCR32DRAFT_300799 [Anaeromyces robustus]|uniref:Protein NO VEIN C-terminal domain-containing protein n=1 Tax=Anaeromyces robustus TaxID=1754192 RepID=A0A1Y1X182_9FUNG|nr:hypothetical protein BCR32DRAFT_300799 [Anaeromyces robustus]|eukprot:ORX79571.1 hypothetical protein BCR32DRAFT_300799 [Anaeromyces robustus]